MIKIIQTKHWINQAVTKNFALGCKSQIINVNKYFYDKNDIIATYGILRGTGEILQKATKYYYIDHGYFGSSKRSFNKDGKTILHNLDGYFRIVQNNLIHSGLGNFDDKRLKLFNIKFKIVRKSGEFIILSEPSKYISNFFKLTDWTNNTIRALQKYTDRKIFTHSKNSEIPLDKLLQHAWAFVSFQSTAGFKAMINGVPAHFTHDNLKNINSIENIESGLIDYQIFNNLAYGQWTMEEMKNGEMMEYL